MLIRRSFRVAGKLPVALVSRLSVPASGSEGGAAKRVHEPSKGRREAEAYINLHERILGHLKAVLGLPAHTKAKNVLAKARDAKIPAVEKHWTDLVEMMNIRNTNVHSRHYPHEFIAPPSPRAIERLRRLAPQILESAPPLYQRHAKEVKIFELSTPLMEAHAYMLQKRFSQIVVRLANGDLGMLGSATISQEMHHEIQGRRGRSLAHAKIADLIGLESPKKWRVLSAKASELEARRIFDSERRKDTRDVYAILITEDGKRNGKVIGIITSSDPLMWG